MLMRTLLGLMLICFGHSEVAAQQAVNVFVKSTAEDSLGKRLVFELRERIEKTTRLNLVYGDEAAIQVNLVTLNPSDESSYGQSSTIYSLVLLFRERGEGLPRYLSQYVGTCGSNKIQSCAADFVSDIDEWANVFREIANKN